MLFYAAVVAVTLLLIAGACLYPFIHSKLLQWKMVHGLIKDSCAMGYKYRKFYKNIFFVRNFSFKYDIIIYDDERLYAIKLWRAAHSRSTLVLNDGGIVYDRRTVPSVMDISHKEEKKNHVKGSCRKVPKTRLPKKYMSGREICEVILIYPSYTDIVYEGGGQKIVLNIEDELFDKTIYSPSVFLAELSLHKSSENINEEAGSISENI